MSDESMDELREMGFPYRRPPLGTKALQRLGKRIAQDDELTESESELYRSFIADADLRKVITQTAVDAALSTITELIPRVSPTATGRTKTLKTLREKLVRTPNEKLPSIRDVAGVRVVSDCGLLELRLLATLIAGGLSASGISGRLGFTGEAVVIDRLTNPMFGYRAIHVVVRLDGAPVEIQLRTSLQHAWASLMELLCDRWGREPRYGLPIVEPDPKLRMLKVRVIDTMMQLSEQMSSVEKAVSIVGMTKFSTDVADLLSSAERDMMQRLMEHAPVLDHVENLAKNNLRDNLSELGKIVTMIEGLSGEEA